MEGKLHWLLKRAVMSELKKEGFTLFLEPKCSPFERLWWYSFRPDVLGLFSDESKLTVALVECETAPSRKRLLNKTRNIISTLRLQKKLNEKHLIRPILCIPPLYLKKVNYSDIRRFWDIWIVNQTREIIYKIPSCAVRS